MGFIRTVATAFTVAAALALGSNAAGTEESQLSCQPTEVEINEPVVCYVYVRDSLQEPTTSYAFSDFAIRVITEEVDASPVVSDFSNTDDPTVIKFSVASPTGTELRIDVVVKSSGLFIRDSGITVSALTWPATELGSLSCDTDVLKLRSSTICTAPLFGPNGVPASVHTSDVYFSEDHAAGSFVFLSGVRQLIFNFTAPASLLAAFDSFTIRVTLSAANRVYSLSLPMAYPTVPASERSLLRCADSHGSDHTCFVSAADSYGPVVFNPAQFTIVYERIVDGEWTDITSAMTTSFSAGTNAASGTLSFSPKIDNEIYTARVHVISKGKDILSSPNTFQMGVAPTWSQLSFRGCTAIYVTTSNVTQCTIDVSDDVTADPSYVTVTSRIGGVIVGPTFATEGNKSILTFTYSPPGVGSRVEEYLSVTAGGVNILSSPFRLIVYPDTTDTEDETDTDASRPAQIVIGFIFFGTILAVGSGVLIKRSRQAQQVKQYRAMQAAQQQEDAGRNMNVIVSRNASSSVPSSATASFGDAEATKVSSAATAAAPRE